MAAKRFQIYLSSDQHHQIRSIAQSKQITMAEVIRQAVDLFLDKSSAHVDQNVDSLWTIIGITGNQTSDQTPKESGN